jgi:hypothetical protein
MKNKQSNIHYVNNSKFSLAIVEYVKELQESKANGLDPPIVPNYIALCFLKIAENLSHKGNFIRYTYREEMVMDAVENCLRAIENYDINTTTRTGKPNAFAYFTQIIWYAFLRRIAKEKKQQEIKERYLSQSGIEMFMEIGDDQSSNTAANFVDHLKDRIDRVKEYDKEIKEYSKKERKKKKSKDVDSDIQSFME